MADAITFKITEAGRQALASGAVRLSHVAAGSAKRLFTGNEVALTDEVVRTEIISGGVEPISKVLRFSADFVATGHHTIYEVGVITDRGVLFAVASSKTTAFFTVCSTTNFAASFGISLSEDAAGVTVLSNNAQNKPLASMEAHLSPSDPHAQYLDVIRFQLLLDTAIPIGYLYFSHSDINPKPLFDELLGIETEWRRVTGKSIVAIDLADPFISHPHFLLGQEGMTTSPINQVPNAYPLHATHIWERVAPNEVRYDGKHKYDGNANYQ